MNNCDGIVPVCAVSSIATERKLVSDTSSVGIVPSIGELYNPKLANLVQRFIVDGSVEVRFVRTSSLCDSTRGLTIRLAPTGHWRSHKVFRFVQRPNWLGMVP